jgi:TonB-linked SusC/RagA family outer membrane protein
MNKFSTTTRKKPLHRLLIGKMPLVLFALLCVVPSLKAADAADAGSSAPASMETQQQKVRVRGTISDDLGEPLPGATVQVQGTGQGAIADGDGKYEMEVPQKCKLVFQFLGMITQTIDYNGEREVNVKLISNETLLEEVEVVAFSKQKKESVVASISTVRPADLKVPSSNLTAALGGRVAGLISYQLSGEPGQDNASFFIRGITTFGAEAKKDPLILIDGMELGADELARLNTDDIASFSIMKDASATALYGARGANGVILVTTKEGKVGKVKVAARVENAFSSPTQMVKLANPVTYMRMQNEAVKTRDPLAIMPYTEEKIVMTERGLYPDLYPAIDWHDVMFNDVISNQRANISLSGGGEVARYYVAFDIAQDHGNIKVDNRNNFNSNINLLKYNVRSNININLTKTTELITRLNVMFDEYTGPYNSGSEMYEMIVRTNPVLFKPYYEPDEYYSYAKHILFGNYATGNYLNPYAESLKGYKDYSKNQALTQFELKQNLNMITEGLTARVMLNMDRYSEYSVLRQYVPFYYNISSYNKQTGEYTLKRLNTNGDESISYAGGLRDISTVVYLESALEYNGSFSDVHNLQTLLVYTMRQQKYGSANTLQLGLPHRNISLSGRVSYNYDTRYFLEFVFGYNGSERFSKEKRYGFFPALSGGWMISNEAFFEDLKPTVKTLKLKGSYGIVGSDQVGSDSDRFYYLSEVNKSSGGVYIVDWGSNMSYTPNGYLWNITRYGNDQIGWETAYMANIGLEFETKFGLAGTFEVYHQKRTNIMVDRIMPRTMGIIPSVKANLGVGQSKGVDAELNWEHNISKDLWFIGRGTFTFTRSKVLEWEEPDYSKTPWLSRIGLPINQTWGYIAERLFVDDAEVENSPTQFGTYGAGDIKYRDVNGDGKITTLDQVPIGYPTEPEINYGFGLTVGYKNFDFNCFFSGQGRKSFWINTSAISPFVNDKQVMQVIADSYWSETNRDPYAFWPRLSNTAVENNTQTSTWFMQDASFLRLSTMEIGYRLPDKLLRKVNLSDLRFYMSGQKLFNISSFKLWDPEVGSNGLGYPLQKIISVGLTIGI